MKIKYFAWLKEITKVDIEQINEVSVKDIVSLKKFICQKYPKLKKYILKDNIIRIAVNLEQVNYNKKLKQVDEIALFPPVSGG